MSALFCLQPADVYGLILQLLCSQWHSPSHCYHCSWEPAVKQINLPQHHGSMFPSIGCWRCLSVRLPARLCAGLPCESLTMAEWHFDGFHLELGWRMIDLTPRKWEHISLGQQAVVSWEQRDPNRHIHFILTLTLVRGYCWKITYIELLL